VSNRCHIAALEAIDGVPSEILYDRMKTAVIGETTGSIVYNRALIDFARHYSFHPKACGPYGAKTTNEAEQLFLRGSPDARARLRDEESGMR